MSMRIFEVVQLFSDYSPSAPDSFFFFFFFFFFSFLFYCHKERGAENQVQEKLYGKLYRFQFIFMDNIAAGQITTILSLCRSYQIESALSTLLEAYHKIV